MGENNVFEKEEQRYIAWQSQTLFERIDTYKKSRWDSFASDEAATDDVDEFFTEWAEIVTDGDQETFKRRLLDEGMSERVCRECISMDEWPEDIDIPAWVHELDELITFIDKSAIEIHHDSDLSPFVDIIEPFVAYGYEQLLLRTNVDRFSQTAVQSAKEWLIDRLIDVSVEAIHVEFSTFRMLRTPSLLSTEDTNNREDPTQLYTEFVAKMRTVDGLQSFFMEYPVLARLIVTTVNQWIAAIQEFHQRLDQDWTEIRAMFASADEITTISDLNVLTDDRHHDGRSVIHVVLSSNSNVVYKPRSIEPEKKYAALVDELASRASCELKTPVCLPREGYGWVEWISHTECTTSQEVSQYYKRAGMLLGVAYMTYLNDCHFENVIANGAHPVIVDAETIVHPLINSDEGLSLVEDETIDSVMWTGLLPRKSDSPTGDTEVNISGFQLPTLSETEDLSSPTWWKNINRDTMDVVERETSSIEMEDTKNVPRLNGTIEPPQEYVDEIKRGFEHVYTYIRENPHVLSPLDGVDTRVLFGQTHTYASILDSITAPDALRDGETVTLHLEHLIADRTFDGDYNSTRQKIYQAERAALVRLDVPRFVLSADEVHFDGSYIAALAGVSGWDRVAEKIQSLDDDDLTKQLDYIQTSCASEIPPVTAGHAIRPVEDQRSPLTSASDYAFNEYIQRIAKQISQGANIDQDGHVSWIIREYSNNRQLDITVSDNGIYTGRAGIAIFFALLHNVLSGPDTRQKAIKALTPLRHQVHNNELSSANLGTSNGIGSHLYALSKVGQLLERPGIVDDAEVVAHQLTADRITNDTNFDVMNGCAGLLLSLVGLYNLRHEEWILRKAIACGDHLLQNRCDTGTPYRAWPSTLGSRPLTGFSHGAAGIAYALYRLFDVCDDDRFRQAAEEGLRYEQTTYSSDRQNWPDIRGDSPRYVDAWCYGRSGIGLSRLGIAEITDRQLVQEDFAIAVAQTSPTSDGTPDQLCCGNAGRIDFLLRAAEYTNENSHREKANRLLRNVLARAEENRCFALPGHTPTLYNPSLFMGTAGIGYVLLRHQYPTDVPCLLLYE